MIEIQRPEGAALGRYTLVAVSSAAESEWRAFVRRSLEAAIVAYERLSSEPLERQPRRQFPLRGKQNKGFWEFEATRADRIYYAVDIEKLTIIIAVRADVHSGAKVSRIVRTRAGKALSGKKLRSFLESQNERRR